ncbi:MAG: DUF2784 domain-containing protein [Pirellulaceae bacterium]
MQLAYRVLADLIVVVHAAYVLWVVVGLLLVWIGWWRGWDWVRNFWMRTTHLVMILVVVAESWWGITCPLTTWERYFRDLSGGQTYRGDFVAHVVHGLLFYDAPAWGFTLAYTLFGVAVLASFLAVPPRRRPLRVPQ